MLRLDNKNKIKNKQVYFAVSSICCIFAIGIDINQPTSLSHPLTPRPPIGKAAIP